MSIRFGCQNDWANATTLPWSVDGRMPHFQAQRGQASFEKWNALLGAANGKSDVIKHARFSFAELFLCWPELP